MGSGTRSCDDGGMATKKPKHDLGTTVGDVYACPLSDGRLAAIHVIDIVKDGTRRGRDSATIVCTAYLGREQPGIDDPALRRVLRQNRFRYEDEPCVMTTDEPPPADFVCIGSFAPTEEEKAIEVMGRSGASWLIANDVLSEWRWENDREALVREVEAQAATRRAPPPVPAARRRTPRSKLTEVELWKLLETVDVERRDGDAAIEPLIVCLAKRSAADIREFQELLAEKLYALDARRFAEHAGDAGSSADAFLYARCFVVAKGKKTYESVLAAPERFPPDCDLEALLTAAPEAFLRRTGDDYDEVTHYSYETGSNVAGWAASRAK